VAEGFRGVADGDVGVELSAWVFGSWNAEGLECCYLFWV
jgi:hypothetical protein